MPFWFHDSPFSDEGLDIIYKIIIERPYHQRKRLTSEDICSAFIEFKSLEVLCEFNDIPHFTRKAFKQVTLEDYNNYLLKDVIYNWDFGDCPVTIENTIIQQLTIDSELFH